MKRWLCSAGMVAVLAQSVVPAMAGKEEARDVATGISVIGGAAVLAPEPTVTKAAGTGALIGQGLGFIGMGIWNLFASAPARARADFRATVQPQPVALTRVGGIGPAEAFAAINRSIDSGGRVLSLSRAVDASLTGYYGAAAAGNETWTAFHRVAASEQLFALEAELAGYRQALRDVTPHVQGTDFAALTAPLPSLQALRAQVITSGFPAFEQFVFDQAQATPFEVGLAIGEMELATLTRQPREPLTGAMIFDDLAWAYGFVDLRELLPGGFPLIPEPAGLLVLSIGALALHGSRRARRSRDSRCGSAVRR